MNMFYEDTDYFYAVEPTVLNGQPGAWNLTDEDEEIDFTFESADALRQFVIAVTEAAKAAGAWGDD